VSLDKPDNWSPDRVHGRASGDARRRNPGNPGAWTGSLDAPPSRRGKWPANPGSLPTLGRHHHLDLVGSETLAQAAADAEPTRDYLLDAVHGLPKVGTITPRQLIHMCLKS
jgi:hypothetical protein